MGKKIVSAIVKIVLMLILIILVIYGFIKIVDSNRVSKLTSSIIGDSNLEYVTKLDSEIIGFTDFRETYIYQINNLKKISCEALSFDMKTNLNSITFDNLAEKYLNEKNNYCIKRYEKNDREFTIVVLQDNILMIQNYED